MRKKKGSTTQVKKSKSDHFMAQNSKNTEFHWTYRNKAKTKPNFPEDRQISSRPISMKPIALDSPYAIRS